MTGSGGVWIYDDGDYIHIWVGVWVKPFLAYGEKIDKDGDGVIGPDPIDENGDGDYDREDLKSDGIIILRLGDPYGTGKDAGYRWKVGSNTDGSPENRRDPEITVPSWDLNLLPGGVLDGKIVYIAKIPIPTGQTSFDIYIEVHASPTKLSSPFVVPEFPMGTLVAVSTLLLALGIWTKIRR